MDEGKTGANLQTPRVVYRSEKTVEGPRHSGSRLGQTAIIAPSTRRLSRPTSFLLSLDNGIVRLGLYYLTHNFKGLYYCLGVRDPVGSDDAYAKRNPEGIPATRGGDPGSHDQSTTA